MECNFKIGQRVICITDYDPLVKGFIFTPSPILPQKYEIYTIRDIHIGEISNNPCLLFEEIPDQSVMVTRNNRKRFLKNLIFSYCNFRPLKKISVEDFLPAYQLELA